MNKPVKDHSIKARLSEAEMCKTLSIALKQDGLISGEDTAVIFYDLSFPEDRILGLKNLFPPSTLHAIAVKANPLPAALNIVKELGAGVEVASLPELYLAEKAGFAPENIVFDSPCKTRHEIEYALKLGVYINADSFDELDRIDDLLKILKSGSSVGLRINPQVGTGTIVSTSVADTISKFGVPLDDNHDKLMEYYLKYSWLKGVHVHIGSQGCEVHLMLKGIKKALNFTREVNQELKKMPGGKPVDTFDIGGGLPVSYDPSGDPITMEAYHKLLLKDCSELFNGQFRLITEFGRYIYANSAWVASKIEYVKRERTYNIAMTHVGADLFLRKCYNPGDWHHHISLAGKDGELKRGKDKNKYIVAGPLCFAGDVIAKDLELPVAAEGDFLLIHDAGAYTLSMWSRYNSRQIPKVIGYRPGTMTFEVIKERESKDDLYEFWT
ncbi:MAG: diaminopimelate decarboxylase [Bacteroidales bacterium]|nr:diaminopimelate decarboxylase [Bacteroidales bacterium]